MENNDIGQAKQVEKDILTLGNSQAGKQLVSSMRTKIVNLVDVLVGSYKTGGQDVMPLIAQIDANIEVLRHITGAESRLEVLKQMEKDIEGNK